MARQPSATASWLRFALITVLVGAGAWIYTRVLWESFPAFVVGMDNCDLLFCDFVRHYWRMGRALLEVREPVQGFLYSPFFALLMVPLGELSKSTAIAVWGAVQGLSLAGLFAVPLWHRPLRRPWAYAVYAVAFAASVPLYHNFKWGQVSVPLTLLVLVALELERRGRSVWAGWLLAFAAAIKGYAGLFAWVLLARRRGRGLLAFVGGVALFALVVPALFLGPADAYRFYEVVADRLAAAQTGFSTNPNSQSFASVLSRWGVDPQVQPPEPAAFLRALGYALAALMAALSWRWLRRDPPAFAPATALLLLSLPLALQTAWPHYFAFLPAVIAVAVARVSAGSTPRWWRIASGIWIAVCLVGSSLAMLQLTESWYLYSRGGWLLWVDLALVAWIVADHYLPPREIPA